LLIDTIAFSTQRRRFQRLGGGKHRVSTAIEKRKDLRPMKHVGPSALSRTNGQAAAESRISCWRGLGRQGQIEEKIRGVEWGQAKLPQLGDFISAWRSKMSSNLKKRGAQTSPNDAVIEQKP